MANVRNKQIGVTLVELLVTLTMLGILVSIAVPMYRQYVIRVDRTGPKTLLFDAYNRQVEYIREHKVYAENMGELYGVPSETLDTPEGHYVVSIDRANAGFTYVITATPKADGPQAEDGPLTINHLGVKTPEEKWK